MKRRIFLLAAVLAGCLTAAWAEADPNFYVYLCFGQSNMEGNAQWETVDNTVDTRFRMFATAKFTSPARVVGNEYVAKPPIVNPVGKLGMSDYFGRTMVAALPKDVKVAVVAGAMGGSPIEMFDKDKCEKTLAEHPDDWWAIITKQHYGGNAYQRLIDTIVDVDGRLVHVVVDAIVVDHHHIEINVGLIESDITGTHKLEIVLRILIVIGKTVEKTQGQQQ